MTEGPVFLNTELYEGSNDCDAFSLYYVYHLQATLAAPSGGKETSPVVNLYSAKRESIAWEHQHCESSEPNFVLTVDM